MLSIYLATGNHKDIKMMEVYPPIDSNKIMRKLIETFGIASNYYFLKNNGRLVELDDIIYNGDILLQPRLCGGKGGFGSMLRAIGAQIEKTTNREACRDLSGRRLRDINEEKRLKAWIEKQSKRNEEAAERKKRKLEKLCAEPKHEFKDKSYYQQRSDLTERVEDAVEVGFAASSSSGIKRSTNEDSKSNLKKKRKTILDLDDDIDSDDLESSDNSDSEESNIKKHIVSSKSDVENSLDDTANYSKSSSVEEKSDLVNYSPVLSIENTQHISG
ncbi:PREDICTED: protein SDE2 homolog [Ceratosolen solmsi marchali]|uniref:Protein SDE2 homolog n=1 Tax=Ceratosolen solmsi marchali TaxID=326594 RepID=A0AAJ6YU25_9HYME|nr:PREDICTED: protein SDE2 homolog [Ceratosolen solmsi marchali]